MQEKKKITKKGLGENTDFYNRYLGGNTSRTIKGKKRKIACVSSPLKVKSSHSETSGEA